MKKNIEDEEVLEVINEKYMELFPAEKKVVGMERSVGDPSVLRQIGLSEY